MENARELLRDNLIFVRARARFSQVELAARSGVSRPTISRIERAEADVGIDVLGRIADALGVDIARLFRPDFKGVVDDAELLKRANDPPSEFVDADDFFAALDEAEGRVGRYSRAGRPGGKGKLRA